MDQRRTFPLKDRDVSDGTILIFGIQYQPGFSTNSQKTYTYVMLKAGGFWYVTGSGKTPQTAGWGAVQRWLARDGRVVQWVRHVTETSQLWPEVHQFEASHSGMVCGAMVQSTDGTGDQCGKTAEDPVHTLQ